MDQCGCACCAEACASASRSHYTFLCTSHIVARCTLALHFQFGVFTVGSIHPDAKLESRLGPGLDLCRPAGFYDIIPLPPHTPAFFLNLTGTPNNISHLTFESRRWARGSHTTHHLTPTCNQVACPPQQVDFSPSLYVCTLNPSL